MDNCYNCGLPYDAIGGAGRSLPLETKPQTAFRQRASKHTVWCCSDECAIQALAQAKYGTATHKWPVTLTEFRQIEGIPFLRRLDAGLTVTKPTRQTRINKGVEEGDFEKLGLPHAELLEPLEAGFRNAGGRPRQHLSAAAKQRAYRQRVKVSPAKIASEVAV